MKFDYYNNANIDRQISHHNMNRYGAGTTKFRELFRSKKIHNKKIMFCLILVEILIVLLIAGYYISPLNRITDVSVSGNHTIMNQNIVSDMKANRGDSVSRLLHHRSHFEKYTFNQNAQLKSINVGLHNWNRVNIRVREYPIIAYLKINHQYYAVSNNGRRAYQNTKPDEVDPIISNFNSRQILDEFVKSYKLVPDSIKPDINKVYYKPTKVDPTRIRVDMNDGNRIYANLKTWSRKMKYYPAISKSMKKNGIINLELGAYSKEFKRSNHK